MMGSREWMKPDQYLLLEQGNANCIKEFFNREGNFLCLPYLVHNDNPLICFCY